MIKLQFLLVFFAYILLGSQAIISSQKIGWQVKTRNLQRARSILLGSLTSANNMNAIPWHNLFECQHISACFTNIQFSFGCCNKLRHLVDKKIFISHETEKSTLLHKISDILFQTINFQTIYISFRTLCWNIA